MKPLNLDANATYGLLPEVDAAFRESGVSFLNPSSIHQGGQYARATLETSRDSIRSLVGLLRDGVVIFTSGATEANNTAIFSPFWPYLSVGKDRKSSIVPSLIISAIEHPSVLAAAKKLEEQGVCVHKVMPRLDGRFYPEDFAAKLEPHTKLVSVMYVNNETGQVLPIREIAAKIRSVNPKVLIHTDAVQALGKLPLDFDALGVDLMSLSGHKIGALSGIGALVHKPGLAIDPLIVGGPQEVRRRAGTENVVGAYSFGIAARTVELCIEERREQMHQYRSKVKEAIKANIPGAIFNLEDVPSVGNTLSVRFPSVYTGDLVVALDLEGVYVSSGSACASGKPEPSETLQAMGLSEAEANESIRISVLADYEDKVFADGLNRMVSVLKRIRGS